MMLFSPCVHFADAALIDTGWSISAGARVSIRLCTYANFTIASPAHVRHAMTKALYFTIEYF